MRIQPKMKRFSWMFCFLTLAAAASAAWGMGKSAEVNRISKEEVLPLLGKAEVVLLDVRESGDWKESQTKIQGAFREDPLTDVQTWISKYPPEKTYILYCT